MAKINYERLNNERHTTLNECKVGDIIEWEDDVYIVTNSYEDIKSDTCYRAIMNITNYDFGEIEYIDENVNVKVLEDAEITIKY